MRPVLFEVSNVSLVRGGRRVLYGFSAQFPEGASCVSGPSGSGKSTLLRLLNRLADPDSGQVLYRGEDVRKHDPRRLRREVCLVPQIPTLVEGSVADNLRFAASFGTAAEHPDPSKLLPLAGLDPEYAERDAARLSVGEQQRVMLVRALAVEPSVLLLDEPTSALDGEARDTVELALAGLREKSGLSLVVVTHDPVQAERLADKVIRMKP